MDARAIADRLRVLACEERQLKVQLIELLGPFDEERLYLELGYPSCCAFLTQALGFSNASAYRRITAARLLRKLPTVVEWISSGRVSLTKLGALKDVLTVENHRELLDQAS